MKTITYYIKRLFKMDLVNMIKLSKEISNQIKRPTIVIMIDMIICSLKYKSGYIDYYEYEFFLLNTKQRKTYLTTGINNELVKQFNQKNYYDKFNNKIVFNKIFDKYLGRKWIDLLETSIEEFEHFLKENKKIIVKPIDESSGNGIEIIEINKKTNTKELYRKLTKNKQTLVEEVLNNHKDMNKLYDGAVNTLRLISFYDGHETHILATVLKMGNGGVLDNFAAGGMYTFLDDNGIIIVDAIDKFGKTHSNHPISKTKIIGFQVPLFNEAIKLIKTVSPIVKEIQYVGWDVAITKDKPVIIEGNQYSGIFQIKASLNKEKTGSLPRYEKAMKIKKYK